MTRFGDVVQAAADEHGKMSLAALQCAGVPSATVARWVADGSLRRLGSRSFAAAGSAIRLRLVSEQRLRTRTIARHTSGVNGGRRLLDALVDSGGESRLERWFLRAGWWSRSPATELTARGANANPTSNAERS